jgi:hypothetical protein
MVTDSRRRRKPAATDRLTASKTTPSPEQVRDMAAEIRESWTPRQRRHRALLARYLVLRQLIVSGR